jgi:hypothetical protein
MPLLRYGEGVRSSFLNTQFSILSTVGGQSVDTEREAQEANY